MHFMRVFSQISLLSILPDAFTNVRLDYCIRLDDDNRPERQPRSFVFPGYRVPRISRGC